jgi:hypothetical protein
VRRSPAAAQTASQQASATNRPSLLCRPLRTQANGKRDVPLPWPRLLPTSCAEHRRCPRRSEPLVNKSCRVQLMETRECRCCRVQLVETRGRRCWRVKLVEPLEHRNCRRRHGECRW